MNTVKDPEEVGSGGQLAHFLALLAIVAACSGGWHYYKEGKRQIADANAAVEADINVYLPKVFATLSETVSSDRPLTPDTIYSGNGSRIVAFYKRTEVNYFSSDDTRWEVLAQSKAGTYFDVAYELCTDCGVDIRGVDRISKSRWPIRTLTVDQAKDWLYRAGLRNEFKTEFGTDAPPTTVQG